MTETTVDFNDETDEERVARLEEEALYDEFSKETVDLIIEKMLEVIDELSQHPLYPYQRPFARRLLESLIIGDGATITALFSRQCLDGDTIVFNQDGTATRLRNMDRVVATGVQPTKRYRIHGGAEVVMTDNHPVLTPGGWTAAGLLRKGDKVSVLTYNNQWLGSTKIDREIHVGRHRTPRRVTLPVNSALAQWLGYFTTDGSFRPRQSPKFTNTREEYLQEFSDLTEKYFGVAVKRYAKGNGADLLLTTSKSSYDNPVLDLLHALDWDHKFPVDVFGWSPDVVADFVNRAWAGDGCITMKKRGPEIFLATGNDEVYARYWQSLLHKFGVQSTIKREQMAGGTGTFYRLVVGSGALNTRRFFTSFGLIYGKEEQSLAAIDFFAAEAMRPSGKGRAERRMFGHHGYGPDGEELGWSTVIDIQDAGERETFDPHVAGKGWVIAQGLQVSNSGKSETVSNTVSACMIMFPVLAKMFPGLMGKFKEGFWVGCFAPTDEQADIVYGRIVARLTSDRAEEFMSDPDINDRVAKGKGAMMYLRRSGSFIRRQTAHPRSSIEGRTYHLMLIDECQDADDRVVNKSIGPMGASTNATMVFIGTPSYTKNVFYKTIQMNKRQATKRGARANHFEADWKEVAKWNKNYERFVKKEMLRLGEDSDEFRLSYRLHWLLDKGMFTTSERLDELGDKSMEIVHAWHKTPVVVGIDPARKQDSTVVTVIWVDWDRPDEFGFYEHRVLNWLDLSGMEWEAQYFRIVEFLSNYRVFAVAVDEGGLGDPIIDRLRVLMPHVEIIPMSSQKPEQSKRWKHLMELINRGKIGWPAHAKTRRLKTWKRFTTQMEDLETKFEGPYMVAAAPRAADAHDDYPDSLALGCAIAAMHTIPEVEISQSPFYSRT